MDMKPIIGMGGRVIAEYQTLLFRAVDLKRVGGSPYQLWYNDPPSRVIENKLREME